MNRSQKLIEQCEASAGYKTGDSVEILKGDFGGATGIITAVKHGLFTVKVPSGLVTKTGPSYGTAVVDASEIRLAEAASTYTILFNTEYNEYRAPGPKGTEAQAIYTDDLDDAKNSMISDWKRAGIDIDPASIKIKKVDEWPKGMGN